MRSFYYQHTCRGFNCVSVISYHHFFQILSDFVKFRHYFTIRLMNESLFPYLLSSVQWFHVNSGKSSNFSNDTSIHGKTHKNWKIKRTNSLSRIFFKIFQKTELISVNRDNFLKICWEISQKLTKSAKDEVACRKVWKRHLQKNHQQTSRSNLFTLRSKKARPGKNALSQINFFI